MSDRPDDDAGPGPRSFDRVEDTVVADPTQPQTPQPPSELISQFLGAGLEQGKSLHDGFLDGTGESSEILLRSARQEELRQVRALVSPREVWSIALP
jgi:hypothetical protein